MKKKIPSVSSRYMEKIKKVLTKIILDIDQNKLLDILLRMLTYHFAQSVFLNIS